MPGGLRDGTCSNLSQVIYNEGWGQLIDGYPEFELTKHVKEIDPTRLVDSTSGWYDHGAGDFSVSEFRDA